MTKFFRVNVYVHDYECVWVYECECVCVCVYVCMCFLYDVFNSKRILFAKQWTKILSFACTGEYPYILH